MKRTIVLSLMLALVWGAVAVPAFPGLIRFTQPNNREITVSIYLKGDERVHWAETEDGYTLLHADDGSLVYATRDIMGDLIPTDMLATDKETRNAEVNKFLEKTPKHLRYSVRQVEQLLDIWRQVENAKSGPKTMSDVTGNKKFLVILFAFSDQSMTHTKLEFRRLFNQVNYTANGSTGSVHDYYHDVSGGLFSLSVDVVGPFTGKRNTAYYGSSDNGSQAFAREAVDSAAKYVDFSTYDNDNDGYIDGLHIIFAGHGEEAGAGSDRIWSHKWNIFNPPTYNNTVVDVYSCSPECSGSGGTDITAIGVICHELGHVFGAPDYYDTDYANGTPEYPGLGQWDIMSSGSWNRSGKCPAQHNPYTKAYIYRWIDCDTLGSATAQYILDPVENGGKVYRVNTSTVGDFFLIENRQQIKWDNWIPGHGMLVYHLHPNAHGRNVDNHNHPQQIYIIARTSSTDTFPTNNPSSYGAVNNLSAAFPGDGGYRDSLTDNSIPWFRPWSKQKNNMPLLNISENFTTKQVLFSVGQVSADPMNIITEGVDQQSITVDWTPYGSLRTLVVISDDSTSFGTPDRTDYHVGDTIDGGGIVVYFGQNSTTLVNGLTSGRDYYFRLYSLSVRNKYSDGVIAKGRTLNCEADTWTSEDFSSYTYGSTPDCWQGSWITDSIVGQQALAAHSLSGEMEWLHTSSRPIVFDEAKDVVAHFYVHMGDGCTPNTCLKVEYRATPSSQWTTVKTVEWNFAMSTWKEVYISLSSVGNLSRLRFSAYCDSTMEIAIDNISLVDGGLVYSTSDNRGTIIPKGYNIIEEGDTLQFTLKPLPGYQFNSLRIDGSVINPSLVIANDDGTYSYAYVQRTPGEHTLSVEYEIKTAIENVEESTLRVYPNPTTGEVTVSTTSDGVVRLYDIRGRLMEERRTEGHQTTIDLGGQPQGVYILKYKNSIRKIVKQ